MEHTFEKASNKKPRELSPAQRSREDLGNCISRVVKNPAIPIAARREKIMQWMQDYPADQVLNAISKHHNDPKFDARIFGEPIQGMSLDEQQKLFGVHPSDMSEDAFFKIVSAYINRADGLILDDPTICRLPESMGELRNLDHLILSDTQVQFLPDSIGKLSHLKTMEVYQNQLKSLPESMGELRNLESLTLFNNQIESLPESIGKLSHLKIMNLAKNQVKSLPESIGELRNLLDLELGDNQLEYLPESIGKLSNLKKMEIQDNQLKSLPDGMGELRNLETLILSNNQLESLPESIGKLSNLKTMELFSNILSRLPESIGELSSLEQLILSNNQLESLPESMGNLIALNTLGIDDNQLTTLPEAMSHLVNLHFLYLAGNQLTRFPAFCRELSNLQIIDIEGNRLTAEEVESLQEEYHESQTQLILSTHDTPQMHLSGYDRTNLLAQVEAIKNQAAQHGIAISQTNPDIWQKLNQPENNALKAFIDRIWETKDGQVHPAFLLRTMVHIFEAMEQNPSYAKHCIGIAGEAIETCGDRVAFGLVHMQLAQKGYAFQSPSLKVLFEAESNMAKADLLFSIARETVQNSRDVIDEIETYLRYCKELQKELGIAFNEMLFENLSHLSEKDIESAKHRLAAVPQNAIWARLLEHPLIKERYREPFEKIQEQDRYNTFPKAEEKDHAYAQRMQRMSVALQNEKIQFLKSEMKKEYSV